MGLPFPALIHADPVSATVSVSQGRGGLNAKPSVPSGKTQSFDTALRQASGGQRTDTHNDEKSVDDTKGLEPRGKESGDASSTTAASDAEPREHKEAAATAETATPTTEPASAKEESLDVNTQALLLALAHVPAPAAAAIQNVVETGHVADTGPQGLALVPNTPASPGLLGEPGHADQAGTNGQAVASSGPQVDPASQATDAPVPAQGRAEAGQQVMNQQTAQAGVLSTESQSEGLTASLPPVVDNPVKQAAVTTQEEDQPADAPHSQEASVGPMAQAAIADQQLSEHESSLEGREHHERDSRERTGEGVAGTPIDGSAHAVFTHLHTGGSDVRAGAGGASLGAASAVPSAPASASLGPVGTASEAVPGSSRSVVLEVAQPDLGLVNIRVAVNHDVVHTALLSDRTDVGQYLMAGQDKLHSALQQAGLDLGQFRVDVQQQGAGRSFHQQTPHGQSQGQAMAGDGQGHGAGQPMEANRPHRQGLLSLVA